MSSQEISPEFQAAIEKITAKRPKTVLDHILKHGYITTDELKQIYGYNHPPRAARDVREKGIQLETFKVKGPDGRTIGAYRFADASLIDSQKRGRRIFPKRLKNALLARDGEQCQLCRGLFPSNTLQIDHKVPYEVSGDAEGELQPENFMLLCGSCNRAKSWACEHCENWKAIKDAAICKTCMFASPACYDHIAMSQRRQLTLNWKEDEVRDYDLLNRQADREGQQLEEYVKRILKSRHTL
jgi:hypothetical protein